MRFLSFNSMTKANVLGDSFPEGLRTHRKIQNIDNFPQWLSSCLSIGCNIVGNMSNIMPFQGFRMTSPRARGIAVGIFPSHEDSSGSM